jgi:gluconolactonase
MRPHKSSIIAALVATAATQSTKSNETSRISNNQTTSIPEDATYILPPQFQGNFTQNFIDTNTSNSSLNALFTRARSSPFISYSPEFTSLLGPSPQLKLIAERPDSAFAYEAGVWVPSKSEVWFTSSYQYTNPAVYILNLDTSQIHQPNLSQPIANPNGGYYFNNKVYITAAGNETWAGGIYSIDTNTYQTDIEVNSYFGVRFNLPDDVTLGAFPPSSSTNTTKTHKPVIFFTDPGLRAIVSSYTNPDPLPNAVWRFSPTEQLLTSVISRADILIPNGIRVNANFTKLYVTDSTPIPPSFNDTQAGGGYAQSGSPAIYSYDLSPEGYPYNKRMLGIARHGIPDGLHIDDAGRIWTGEGEGIVVRSAEGRVLGLFNAEALLIEGGKGSGQYGVSIANFALAGDVLVILALQRIWTVKLSEVLIDPERYDL